MHILTPDLETATRRAVLFSSSPLPPNSSTAGFCLLLQQCTSREPPVEGETTHTGKGEGVSEGGMGGKKNTLTAKLVVPLRSLLATTLLMESMEPFCIFCSYIQIACFISLSPLPVLHLFVMFKKRLS